MSVDQLAVAIGTLTRADKVRLLHILEFDLAGITDTRHRRSSDVESELRTILGAEVRQAGIDVALVHEISTPFGCESAAAQIADALASGRDTR